MFRPILPLLIACACLVGLSWPAAAAARSATAHIERVDSAVATMHGVRVDLAWAKGADHGQLRLRAERVQSPSLGYDFHQLDWQCPLQRDGNDWRCDGLVHGGGAPMRLAVAFEAGGVEAALSRDRSRVELHRDAATPDLTRINLVDIPLAWTQALLAQAWSSGRITGGRADAALAVSAPTGEPLRISGPVAIRAAGFDTPDGRLAGENLGARLAIDAALDERDRFTVDGQLLGGELLLGTTYVSLQERPVDVRIEAVQGEQGWQLPAFAWHDPGILKAEGSAALGADATLRALDVSLHSPALAALADGYLSGWLGVAGLADLALQGAADAHVQLAGGALQQAHLALHQSSFEDARGRFAFRGVDGDVRFSATSPVDSVLRWDGGAMHGLAFGPAHLPFRSAQGRLALVSPVEVPLLGGTLRISHMDLRPPSGTQATDLRFGLALDGLDVAELSAALGWPAFTGELSGTIPEARYADERVEFDGGLSMQLFGGEVSVGQLSMERPFGVLPTLSADVGFEDIDLMALTGAFDFGSISGKLDGRIADLRLVDWRPVAFDARLRTDRHPGVRQRISQRAVQDLTSVGNSSFVGSLQAQLIGFFDDFGYSRIGIGCTLVDEVCTMDGLGSVGEGFIIVQGSGLPRLTVVGYNRRVDWPTLVERLAAVGTGDVKPVVE